MFDARANGELFCRPPEYTVSDSSTLDTATKHREQARSWMFDLDFSPPEGLTLSLWRSLLINFADRFAPERLPPLQLTSKPVPVMLPGELFELPWYRTIFSNIADVVSPETLPPLEL